MFLNWLVAFIIPWVLCTYLFVVNRKTVVLMTPVTMVVAYVINEMGYLFEWWKVHPPVELESLTTLPFDLGLYPVLASYFIHWLQRTRLHPGWAIAAVAAITTTQEVCWLALGRVEYGRGWNVAFTFCSYFIAYLTVFGYYKLIQKYVPDL